MAGQRIVALQLTAKSASFFLPPFKAATSQRGLFPLPAQVSLRFAGLRNFTASVLGLLCPLAPFLLGPCAAANVMESSRRRESVSRLRSPPAREATAVSTRR